MILHPRASFCFIAVTSLLAGCGFHLRKEAQLPAAMQRVHIEIADPGSPLAKDLSKALPRSGAQVVDTAEAGVAVLKIAVNTLSTDVLSVGGTARANEYALRYHVEFSVEGADGSPVVPKQTIELSREFTFDASQALGVAAETDLLGKELERDMVQTILRRLEALGKANP
jgi:LPS-assembly lipoprotein